MKIKTSEATNLQIDWLVAKSTQLEVQILHSVCYYWRTPIKRENFKPSTDWAQGGPILSSERISRTIDHSGLWVAYWTDGYGEEDYCKKWMQCDRSELVAGLRCYVASKLGNEIDVPDELINN